MEKVQVVLGGSFRLPSMPPPNHRMLNREIAYQKELLLFYI
ncbi:hypothetical protein VDG1235_1630 [Verrucomicrobiia bacterium DG1235]|nr:hypothetical protein VDG1235_1630 [Verrucomicrobiae bacterium DG1235]